MVDAKKEKLPLARNLIKKVRRKGSNLLERLVPILLVASIGFAFAIGSMWQRIKNLESTFRFKVAGLPEQAGKKVATAGNTQTSGTTSEIQKEILPSNYKLGIRFNDAITKMVQMGAIDKDKFIKLYEERSPLTESQKKLLESSSGDEIVLNADNAQLILNLLWPLGISNKAKVLSEGPMGTQYKDEIDNFASTAGWTLGKTEGGKLFNSLTIISLTPDQENLVKEIAESIYRPCCGNHTGFPDCNHGAAMLGFIELAVSQGMSKDEIYKKALVLNSYWFPQNYAEIATYFKAQKGMAWEEVNPKEVLGVNYSSGQGYAAINKELQAEGLLPKVQSGGGGCGV